MFRSLLLSLFFVILFPFLSSSFFSALQTDSEAHSASYPVGTESSFPEGKAGRA
jgi:hypothetical protein